MLPVWFLNCTEPDELGVAQYCIPAVTYVARDAWTLSGEKRLLSPTKYYSYLSLWPSG